MDCCVRPRVSATSSVHRRTSTALSNAIRTRLHRIMVERRSECLSTVVEVVDDEVHDLTLVHGRNELRVGEQRGAIDGVVPEVLQQRCRVLQRGPGLSIVPTHVFESGRVNVREGRMDALWC